MRYCSTRNQNHSASGAEAIVRGIAPDGGLYVPVFFPRLHHLVGARLPYECILTEVLDAFFPELLIGEELQSIYSRYQIEERVRYQRLQDGYVMELFHGPTCAFKDFALQVLPLLLQRSKQLLGDQRRTLILTATSGDTGSAALAGFAQREIGDRGIDIAVLYPRDGVSAMQEAQMRALQAKNVLLLALDGNFDDAQRMVKQAFLDESLRSELDQMGISLSSANSINIGRLVPQLAYYFYTYNQLCLDGEIQKGDPVRFYVPTGNFGDILAGYYAKCSGLPVDLLVSASNENKVLKEFFETGTYDARRALLLTDSPSMDIVVSSNLERLLYHTSDAQTVSTLMESFAQHQMYQITDAHRARIRDAGFRGGYAKSSAARAYIRAVYEATGYLLDPHTAVAEVVRDTIPSEAASVVLSTASPFKFAKAMCEALEIGADSEQAALTSLSEQSGVGVPVQLAQLLTQPTKEPRFIDQTQLAPVIRKWLKNRTLSIRVPATTANIGPGFDALGIALNLYASFTLRFEGLYEGANEDRMIVAFGEGVPKAYQNQQNLLLQAFYRTAQAQGQVHYPKKLYLDIHSEIPVSRGLGSSAALIVAGVLCAYELTRAPYTKEQVLCAATAIEGHPDNVAPAVYGGFCASVMEGDQAYAMQLAIAPGLHFAAAVPNEELSTSEARGVLPEAVSHHDAADNVAHAAFLIGCLHNGRFDLLRTALRDHLHEPYRRALLPHYNELTELDARGMYISGAGSTVMLLDDRYTAQDYRKRLDAPWLTWYDLCICEQGATICDAYQPEAELELE